jgi:hypothetical protein
MTLAALTGALDRTVDLGGRKLMPGMAARSNRL